MLDPDKLKDLELDYRIKMGQYADKPFTMLTWSIAARVVKDIREKCMKED